MRARLTAVLLAMVAIVGLGLPATAATTATEMVRVDGWFCDNQTSSYLQVWSKQYQEGRKPICYGLVGGGAPAQLDVRIWEVTRINSGIFKARAWTSGGSIACDLPQRADSPRWWNDNPRTIWKLEIRR
ncbi:hypothetical protein AB0P21_19675 [Kribbella sp. NPDC056861]|uniref:hypothetical protein n=1 Tax=Kribbella sp. NPDC056861 TaxID=3154857 RepID=UPI00342D1701